MYKLIPKTYKEIIFYVLIPLFIILIIFALILLFSNKKREKKEEFLYNYKMNYWSSVIGIVFGAILFSASIGFSVLFIERMHLYGLVNQFFYIIVILFIFPLIPLAFLVYFLIKFIKTIKSKLAYNKTSKN